MLTTATSYSRIRRKNFSLRQISQCFIPVDVNSLNDFVKSLLYRFAGMVAGVAKMEKVNLSGQTNLGGTDGIQIF